MRRVLFVDDEVGILDGLRRMLRPMRREWDMVFVASGPDALTAAEAEPFDVIVSDMRMPGMDGAELLERFHRLHPATLRFVLSGYSESETMMRTTTRAHRCLAKPCEPEALKTAIARSLDLAGRVGDPAIRELIHGLGPLPSVSSSQRTISEVLGEPSIDAEGLIEVIESDMAMTAKILQMVNSTLFDQTGAVGSVAEAVPLLGVNVIKDLVLVAEIFDAPLLVPGLVEFQRCLHAWAVATAAVARRIQGNTLSDEAFTAGLLHDIGLLALAAAAPDRLLDVLRLAEEEQQPLAVVEQSVNGTTHAEIGAYLLGLWGLPDVVVDAVAFHHHPHRLATEDDSVAAAVHVASVLVETATPCGTRPWPPHPLDLTHVGSVEDRERLDHWRLLVGDSAGAGWPVGLAP